MILFNKFLIEPLNGEKFISKKKIGNTEIIVNVSIEEAKHVNRYAKILEVPLEYTGIIQKNDIVIVQHNVFRTYMDLHGNAVESENMISKNRFKVVEDEIYLIIRDGEYIAVDKYCFVEPIIEDVFFLGKQELKQIGIMKHSNLFLNNQGVKNNDKVVFDLDAEYEFLIGNKRLYRMFNNSIIGKIAS